MQRMEEGIVDDYLEWVIEKQFAEDLEDAGWFTLKGDKIKRGFADRFCFGPGPTTIIVEFKRLGAPAKRRGEALQNHYRTQFRDLGFETRKVIGWDAAADLYKELLETYRWG